MSIRRPRRRSSARKAASTRACCDENKTLVDEIDRRKVLRGAVSLGALTMLTGCNVTAHGRGAGGAASASRSSTTGPRR